jgi:hypothetical protein
MTESIFRATAGARVHPATSNKPDIIGLTILIKLIVIKPRPIIGISNISRNKPLTPVYALIKIAD